LTALDDLEFRFNFPLSRETLLLCLATAALTILSSFFSLDEAAVFNSGSAFFYFICSYFTFSSCSRYFLFCLSSFFCFFYSFLIFSYNYALFLQIVLVYSPMSASGFKFFMKSACMIPGRLLSYAFVTTESRYITSFSFLLDFLLLGFSEAIEVLLSIKEFYSYDDYALLDYD